MTIHFNRITKNRNQKLKILLIAIGTRGDIEPFLALGEILTKKGHKIIYSFPKQFARLVDDQENFFPLSSKFIELLESEEGKLIMTGGKANILKKIKSIYKLYREGKQINKLLVSEQYDILESQIPDRIVYNSKANYSLIWGHNHSKKTIMLSPVPNFIYYAKGSSHIGFKGNYGSFINKITYYIANSGLVKTIKDADKQIDNKSSLTWRNIKKILLEEHLIYMISPSLFMRPNSWPSQVQLLGYHKKEILENWQPSKELIYFLAQHKKILFLTFGSMMSQHPEKNSKVILKTLNKLQIPTIVNTASGGLIELKEFSNNELFLFVNSVPYEYIFKKMYAIIHHGGSGTTHLAVKNGCASLIIPHIIDQFGWNNIISSKEFGPKGIAISELSEKKIKPLIETLFFEEKYKLNAEKVAEKMRQEMFEDKLCEFVLS